MIDSVSHHRPIQMDLFEVHTESFQDGFRSGANWDANWYPGGPMIYHNRYSNDPKHIELARTSESAYREWHNGFRVGLEKRFNDCPEFKAWWEKNKSARHMIFKPAPDLN